MLYWNNRKSRDEEMIIWILLCGYLAWRVWQSFEEGPASSISQARVVRKTVFCHPADFREKDFLRGVEVLFRQWQQDPTAVHPWLDQAWQHRPCPVKDPVVIGNLSCEDKTFDLKQWEVRVKITGVVSFQYATFVRNPRQDHPHWTLRTLL